MHDIFVHILITHIKIKIPLNLSYMPPNETETPKVVIYVRVQPG